MKYAKEITIVFVQMVSVLTTQAKKINKESFEMLSLNYSGLNEVKRPIFAFVKDKFSAKTETFIQILYPYKGNVPPSISLKPLHKNDIENGKLNVQIKINGEKTIIKQQL